jgi:hypothetical protein
MANHPNVPHPNDILERKRRQRQKDNPVLYANNLVVIWITNHILASVILFDIAFIVPLMTISAPSSVKITLGVISGSWIQWWALPALQRSQNQTQAKQDAKAEADHQALLYMVSLHEKQVAELSVIKQELNQLKANGQKGQ